MGQYRKKPIVIEARWWTGEDITGEIIIGWIIENGGTAEFMCEKECCEGKRKINILTLEGMMTADPEDYIIQGIKGEFYPCKPDIFEASYEAVQ